MLMLTIQFGILNCQESERNGRTGGVEDAGGGGGEHLFSQEDLDVQENWKGKMATMEEEAARDDRDAVFGLPDRPQYEIRDPDPFVPKDAELQSRLTDLNGIPRMNTWSPNLRGSGGFNEKEKWRASPYWRYFRRVWGSAPFIDGNFALWLSGALKVGNFCNAFMLFWRS